MSNVASSSLCVFFFHYLFVSLKQRGVFTMSKRKSTPVNENPKKRSKSVIEGDNAADSDQEDPSLSKVCLCHAMNPSVFVSFFIMFFS